MSIKVSAWVWKHSKHRSTQKLLLLALADFANDSGICWPSTKTLADCIGETERHTRQLIQDLVKSGDVLRVEGGGRGNPSRYAVAVGLTDKQRAKLKDALENTVTKNPVLQNSVEDNSDTTETLLSGDGNPVISGTETLLSGDEENMPNAAPQRAETALDDGGIRHEIRHVDPKNTPARKKRAASPVSTDHQNLMRAYAEWLGYPIPNGGKEGAAAKRILVAGYTIEQTDRCYHELKSRDFYAKQHLSLLTVYEQMGALISARKIIPAVAGSLNGTNGAAHEPYDYDSQPSPYELRRLERAARSAAGGGK